MLLRIDPQGRITCSYGEMIDLAALGALHIRRASYVEPDAQGRWWADLAPMYGPNLGPFEHRNKALQAEQAWLECFAIEPTNL